MIAGKFQPELQVIALAPVEEQPILLGALLSRLFEERGVLLTIVGGAAVQFYTQADYTTGDLDAILVGDTVRDVEEVMGSLGFKRTTTYRHFEHPQLGFVVEFPPSPIEVGNRHIDEINLIRTDLGAVRVIRIEDLIMDRIIAGVEWRSEESLKQAGLLWIRHQDRVGRKYLMNFARQEGYLKTLKDIMRANRLVRKSRPIKKEKP